MAMTSTPAQKTAPKVAPKGDKPEKVKVVRVDYVKSPAAKSVIDDKGKLTAAPVGYDHKLHLAPSKGDFASESVYMHWRADELDRAAVECAERAKRMRQEADALKNQPDPAVRQQVRRLQRLKDQMAALQEQLAKEGITV